jgi:hypothetical protein
MSDRGSFAKGPLSSRAGILAARRRRPAARRGDPPACPRAARRLGLAGSVRRADVRRFPPMTIPAIVVILVFLVIFLALNRIEFGRFD